MLFHFQYAVNKVQTPDIKSLSDTLKSAKPTLFEAERAFSYLGYYVCKITSRLSDESISKKVFFKYYFSRKESSLLRQTSTALACNYFNNLQKSCSFFKFVNYVLASFEFVFNYSDTFQHPLFKSCSFFSSLLTVCYLP